MNMLESIADRQAPAELDFRVPGIIEPQWWTGENAIDLAAFTVNATTFSKVAGLLEHVRTTYQQLGIARITNASHLHPPALRALALAVMEGGMDYEAGANPRDELEPNVYEVGAPLVAWLHYHHEMAYVGQSPRSLAFQARAATPNGPTYFADNVAATDAILATELGQKLLERGVCYHRILTDRTRFEGALPVGVYNHWQQSLGTENRDEAEARAQAHGLETEWGGSGELVTRYHADAFEYFEPLDRNLLFCSVADHGMWFDGWPLVMHLPYEARPLNMTYGDGTPFTRDELIEFVQIYDRAGIRVDWAEDDLVVFCNYRFAHGRPGIHLEEGERRELGVLLGPAFNRVGQR